MTAPRTFQDFDAAAETSVQPLIVGITGPSFSGKTYSALELATGMIGVTGGSIYLIDTESKRALHYKDRFTFRHVPFAPPHSPEAYEQAIDYCVAKGAKVIIVDSMSHEHDGEGGVLDQAEEYLHAKAGEDWQRREKLKWTSWIQPMGQRRRLNRKIIQLGDRVIFIFLYRATDKTKPVKGGEPIHVGWTAETTSKLPYEMTVRFLLPPGSDGKPNLKPDTEFERLSIKMPVQFRDWFKPGLQLTRDLGAKLALWSAGGATSLPVPARASGSQFKAQDIAAFLREREPEVVKAVAAERAAEPKTPGPVRRIEGTGPADPGVIEEIKGELKRLRWTRANVKGWCAQWQCDWPDKIPGRFAVQALQSLNVLPDPEPGSDE
jgi:hypothetical protein